MVGNISSSSPPGLLKIVVTQTQSATLISTTASVVDAVSKLITSEDTAGISTTAAVNGTGDGEWQYAYSLPVTITVATLVGVVALFTVLGNILVLMAFTVDRSIRVPSNYLLASLAVTDLLIGLFSMPLYTLYLLRGENWPLGPMMCDLWLSLDYTVCLVSQYTVFLITVDRYCSVKIPAKYRNWRTPFKMQLMIAVTWIVPTIVFFTSIIGWPYFVGERLVGPTECYAQYTMNKLFNTVLVISYYWVTLIVMIILYGGIYQVALSLHNRSSAKKRRLEKACVTSPANARDPASQALIGKDKANGHHGNGQPIATGSSRVTTSEVPSSDSYNSSMGTATVERSESGQKSVGSVEVKGPSRASPISLNVTKNNNIKAEILIGSVVNVDENSTAMNDLNSPVWKPQGDGQTADWKCFTDEDVRLNGNHTERQRHDTDDYEQGDSLGSSDEHEGGHDDCADDSDPKDEEKNGPGNVITPCCSVFLNWIRGGLYQLIGRNPDGTPKKKSRSKSENRAQKALRTITLILGAFVVFWTPYHVTVLIFGFKQNLGTESSKLFNTVFNVTYWLCYCNSPLNPFCYALSNVHFKKAFIKILKGYYLRRWWRNRN